MACRLWPRGISFSVGLILSDQYRRLWFTDTFAFSAKHLISHHVTTWMMAYVDQAIISGQPSGDALSSLLYSLAVGKHMSIIHLNRVNGVVKLVRYVWEHKFQRPNTHSFPIACLQCWHIVRESPPPTPREAYLPQRPERTQKEGGIRDEIDPSPSRSKSSRDKAEPQAVGLTQPPRESRESETRRPH